MTSAHSFSYIAGLLDGSLDVSRIIAAVWSSQYGKIIPERKYSDKPEELLLAV